MRGFILKCVGGYNIEFGGKLLFVTFYNLSREINSNAFKS
jgi:hypothetical protein